MKNNILKIKKFNLFIINMLKIKRFNLFFINTFNKALSFKKIKFNKLNKFSNFSKILIFSISLLFLYLFYLSIPSLYDKGRLQNDLTKMLLKEFKLDISVSSDISYSILPKPHILIKDAKIFDNNKDSPKEISQIKKLKIFISQKYFLNQNNLFIKNILIQDANFSFQNKDFDFLKSFTTKVFSKKRLKVEKSNFFFKDIDENTINITSIKKLILNFDEKDLQNQIILNGKIFNNNFNLKWYKDFKEENKIITFLNFDRLKIFLKNTILNSDKIKKGTNELSIRNKKILTSFEIKEKNIEFKSQKLKLINAPYDYNGRVSFKPFDMNLSINLERIDFEKLLISNFLFLEFIKTGVLFNQNLNLQVVVASDKVEYIKKFDTTKIYLNFLNGKMNLDNSELISKKIGKIILEKSNIYLNENDELIFSGSFKFSIKDNKEFYKTLQTPKKFRKDINKINIGLEYNLINNDFDILDIRFNNSEENLAEIVDNSIQDLKFDENVNWITIKKLSNKILNNYDG